MVYLRSVQQVCLWGLLFASGAPHLKAQSAEAEQFFESKVRPVLANNCYACHTGAQSGGLRLDSRAAILKGGKSGPAVVPGKPDESLLIQVTSQTHARIKMPPGDKLEGSRASRPVEVGERRRCLAGFRCCARPAFRLRQGGISDHDAATGFLVVSTRSQAHSAADKIARVGTECDRRVHSGQTGREEPFGHRRRPPS